MSRPALSGRRVVAAGLVGGLLFLATARLLVAIVATTTARLSPSTSFWITVLLGGFGLMAGMGLEAVHQLTAASPDPAYRRGRGRSPGNWR